MKKRFFIRIRTQPSGPSRHPALSYLLKKQIPLEADTGTQYYSKRKEKNSQAFSAADYIFFFHVHNLPTARFEPQDQRCY